MLKLLEGAEVEVPVGASSKNAMVPMTMVNTKNILFICGGAFDGLEKLIQKRTDNASLGFGSQLRTTLDKDETMETTALTTLTCRCSRPVRRPRRTAQPAS